MRRFVHHRSILSALVVLTIVAAFAGGLFLRGSGTHARASAGASRAWASSMVMHNSWTTVASMPTARTFLAAASGPDRRIYAIGGTNGSGVLNTLEAYTP